MHGDKILIRTISKTAISDKFGNVWQYHSRSDAHSKAACWAIMFDLMQHCGLLAEHVKQMKVGFGINHEMHDFRMNRKKNLDLVVCTPQGGSFSDLTLADFGKKYGIELTAEETSILKGLPPIRQCPVATTLIALEAKACMTEHLKARPRLYDELASSYQTIIGDTNNAIASALVMINIANTFISTDRNKHDLNDFPANVNSHRQPDVAIKVLEKIEQLPRRSNPDDAGFDAVGVVLLKLENDQTDVQLCLDFGDGTSVGKILTYGTMVERISHLYSTRFKYL